MANQFNTGEYHSAPNYKRLDDNIRVIYSQEIYHAAEPVLAISQVAKRKNELGTQPGKTIQFLRYSQFDRTDDLAEQNEIEVGNLDSSSFQITVTERAAGLGFKEMALRTYFTDTMMDASVQLGKLYARNTDKLAAKVLYDGDGVNSGITNVLYGNNRANRQGIVAGDVFNTDMLDEALAILAENKVPKMTEFDAFVCFMSPRQAKALRNDEKFIKYNMYGSPQNRLRGVFGSYEGIVFIETTMIRRVKGSGDVYIDGVDSGIDATPADAGIDVDIALLLGDNTLGHAVSLPVELRDNGVEDFGRTRKLAYYTIDGFGVIENGHGVQINTAV